MLVNGRKIAEEVLTELKKEISNNYLDLSLGAILVGDDPEFNKFVELKRKAAESIGITFTTYKFPENIETYDLAANIREIPKLVDGILVELPLPKHIDQQAVLNEIPVDKDVDALSSEAEKLFYQNKAKVLPPAAESLKIVLEKELISPKGKKVAVFGQGTLVGKPISYWLEQQGAEVFRIRSKTENPERLSLEADIIITGVGKSGLVTGDMVKDGAVVIDFGYGRNAMGKMVGDVAFESVSSKASLITPVPGGMGPILIAAVLKNLVILNEK